MFYQIGNYIFFIGEGFYISKGHKVKFKNHGVAELPEGGLVEGTVLTFSWSDTHDSCGTELAYPHVMQVKISEIKNGDVTKTIKLKDERILGNGKFADRTRKHHIGNWRVAEQSDISTMQQLGL